MARGGMSKGGGKMPMTGKTPRKTGDMSFKPKAQPLSDRMNTGMSAPAPPPPAIMPGGLAAGMNPLPPPAGGMGKPPPMPKAKPKTPVRGKATGVPPNMRRGR